MRQHRRVHPETPYHVFVGAERYALCSYPKEYTHWRGKGESSMCQRCAEAIAVCERKNLPLQRGAWSKPSMAGDRGLNEGDWMGYFPVPHSEQDEDTMRLAKVAMNAVDAELAQMEAPKPARGCTVRQEGEQVQVVVLLDAE